jgi:hypothetical protein
VINGRVITEWMIVDGLADIFIGLTSTLVSRMMIQAASGTQTQACAHYVCAVPENDARMAHQNLDALSIS